MYDEKSPNIRLEKTISEIVSGYPNEVWPDLKWTIIEREHWLSGGRVQDLRVRDRSEPTDSFRGMVVAPAIGRA